VEETQESFMILVKDTKQAWWPTLRQQKHPSVLQVTIWNEQRFLTLSLHTVAADNG
jgi:hypothetical protein